MNKSESIKELATALAKAQGEMKNPSFDSTNPHFKSQYASLAAVRNATVPILAKFGISVIQPLTATERGVSCAVILLHSSGEWIEFAGLEIPVSKGDAQGMVSAATYAKRTTLQSCLVVVGDADDDGNAATVAKPKPAMADLDKALLVINASPTLKDLQAVFTDAYKAAQAAEDKAAMTIITAAKNKRKEQLQPKDAFVAEMEANE